MERNQRQGSKVCNYCGTVFDGNLQRCPLCGSESEQPVEQPQAQPEVQEKPVRPQRRYLKKKDSVPKGFLVATVIILAATVLILLYFIGDMIGWWPGLEDVVTRETTFATESAQGVCTMLATAPADAVLTFDTRGEIKALTVTVNMDCQEEITVTVQDASVADIAPETLQPVTGNQVKTQKFLVTALAEGETELTIRCGGKAVTGKLICSFTQVEQTSEPAYVPELNQDDITFFAPKESFVAEVTNLPDGAQVLWLSNDEAVASVDEEGRIVAVGSGTTEIVAQVDGQSVELVVRCSFEEQEDTGYALNYTDVTLRVDEVFRLRLYDEAQNQVTDAEYSVGDGTICSLDGERIQGKKPGTTKVTVTYEGQEYTCIIRVKE